MAGSTPTPPRRSPPAGVAPRRWRGRSAAPWWPCRPGSAPARPTRRWPGAWSGWPTRPTGSGPSWSSRSGPTPGSTSAWSPPSVPPGPPRATRARPGPPRPPGPTRPRSPWPRPSWPPTASGWPPSWPTSTWSARRATSWSPPTCSGLAWRAAGRRSCSTCAAWPSARPATTWPPGPAAWRRSAGPPPTSPTGWPPWSSSRDFPTVAGSSDTPLRSPAGGVEVASDIQRPDTTGRTAAVEPPPYDDPAAPPARTDPALRPGAYWTGLVVLATGLAVTVGVLATRVTSIVQTILLAIPLALIGIGLERVGRGTGRGSLRAVGALLLVVAVVGPLVLSLSSPSPAITATPSEPVPPGAGRAELRASMGGGQLQVDSGATGLYESDLRGPGQPETQVTTANDLAVLDLRSPSQRGMLARNRGNDWRIPLNNSLAWQRDADAWRVQGSGAGRFLVQVRATAARIRVHRG